MSRERLSFASEAIPLSFLDVLRTPSGDAGHSLNIFDAPRKRCHQTWVDTRGFLLTLEGRFEGGAVVLEGETTGADGAVKQRIRWFRKE